MYVYDAKPAFAYICDLIPPSSAADRYAENGWPQPISRIALGFTHALVVAGGRVMTFGSARLLGFFDECARREPTELPGLSGVVDACAGRTHSVVLLESGEVLGWHAEEEGGVTFKTPYKIWPLGAEGGSDGGWGGGRAVGVTCGDGFSAAWTDEGRLYVWSADIALLRNEQMSPRLPFPPPESSERKEWFQPMQIPPSVFQNQRVNAAFAAGEGLLVLTEERKKAYLCRPDYEPDYCLSFGLPESILIPSESPSAAFGSDFFLIVLQNQTDTVRRQLFAGSVPPPGNPQAGLSLNALAVGDGKTNVAEVTAGRKFGLARLQNGDIVRVGLDITREIISEVEDSPTLSPDALKTIPYTALEGKVRLLPQSFYLSGGSIFLTDDGLEGAGFWPGPWWNALLSDHTPLRPRLGVFKKKYPPCLQLANGAESLKALVSYVNRKSTGASRFAPAASTPTAGGGCEVPLEWRGGNYTTNSSSEATSLPVRILQYQSSTPSDNQWRENYTTDSYQSSTPLDNRGWLDFPSEGTAVPLHRKVRLGCRGLISKDESLCIQAKRRNNTAFQHRAEYVLEFEDRPSEIRCAGCVVPSQWTHKETPSPSLPLSLELKSGDDPNGTFTEYDKDKPVGAGDVLRLGCRGVLRASGDEDPQRAAEGIECRLYEKDGVKRI
eukprot:Cvel_34104.t1-p1 / transcript=Cvel_34104.t1 / gene=Cvel_34104 / organism=Chromera_velia_CCMP2878 / gene_product=hypothetical protein / transcript_product=hypothetical protein / location=Cvel_scaffold5747:625-4263(-) / protein_length=665 / sequence_SO=supercontig / SO=protein_coding / is_pseudo=false